MTHNTSIGGTIMNQGTHCISFGSNAGLNIHTADPTRTFPEQCNIYNVISKFFNDYTQDPLPYVKLKKEFLNTEGDWEHALNCAIGKINKTLNYLNEKEKELTNKQSQLEEYVGSSWELQARKNQVDAEIEGLKKEKAVLHVECINLQKERDEWKTKSLQWKADEIEQLNHKLVLCERERDNLRYQLETQTSCREIENNELKTLLDKTMLEKNNTIASLSDDIVALSTKLAASEQERDKLILQLEENSELKTLLDKTLLEKNNTVASLSDEIVVLSGKLENSRYTLEIAKKHLKEQEQKIDEKNALLINATKQIEQQNELIKAIKIVAKEFL